MGSTHDLLPDVAWTHFFLTLLLLVHYNADPGCVIPANEGGRQTQRPPGSAQVRLDIIVFLLALNLKDLGSYLVCSCV